MQQPCFTKTTSFPKKYQEVPHSWLMHSTIQCFYCMATSQSRCYILVILSCCKFETDAIFKQNLLFLLSFLKNHTDTCTVLPATVIFSTYISLSPFTDIAVDTYDLLLPFNCASYFFQSVLFNVCSTTCHFSRLPSQIKNLKSLFPVNITDSEILSSFKALKIIKDTQTFRWSELKVKIKRARAFSVSPRATFPNSPMLFQAGKPTNMTDRQVKDTSLP